jgi:hypothetical protein
LRTTNSDDVWRHVTDIWRKARAGFAENPLHALLWLIRVLTASKGRRGMESSSGVRWGKLRDWLNRYGLAECGGVLGALAASFVVRHITGNTIAGAYAAAWGETLGYACTILVRDFVNESRVARGSHGHFHIADAARVMTGLAAEFGPAGALDSFVTRPLAMALGTRALGLPLGVIVGKVGADLLFYVPVIIVYERRKRARRPNDPL